MCKCVILTSRRNNMCIFLVRNITLRVENTNEIRMRLKFIIKYWIRFFFFVIAFLVAFRLPLLFLCSFIKRVFLWLVGLEMKWKKNRWFGSLPSHFRLPFILIDQKIAYFCLRFIWPGIRLSLTNVDKKRIFQQNDRMFCEIRILHSSSECRYIGLFLISHSIPSISFSMNYNSIFV